MSALGRLGTILTLIGGVLLAIAGIITMAPGQVVLDWFAGLTLLILGVGLTLAMLRAVSGRSSQPTAPSDTATSEHV